MTTHSKVYKDKDVQISYFTLGKGAPILFLHGGGVNVLVYKKFLEMLAKRYLVFGVDIPCFGNAGVPENVWGYSDYGDYFKKFLEELSFKNVTIIGHSLGAGIGVSVASKSKLVKNLIVVDGPGLGGIKNKLAFYFTFFITKTYTDITTYKKIYKVSLMGYYFLKNIFKHPLNQLQVLRVVNNTLTQNEFDFKDIRAHTDILWGNKDEIFPSENAIKLNRMIPNSQLQIVEGNHDWCLFHPEKLASLVMKLLK